ncbi:MAG TPA: hypothetical protein VJ821_00250 [Anaerolineales bacterium]|nr:hypothetical protein [Anaerolineales bacterium]
MIITERQIQKVRSGRWTELEDLDKKFSAVESHLGFPAKRRCRSLVGGLTTDTLIIDANGKTSRRLRPRTKKPSLIRSIGR